MEDTQVLEPPVEEQVENQVEEKSEEREFLERISSAETECRLRELDVEEAKSELKEAKARYDSAVSRLRRLAKEALYDADRPLLNQETDKPDPEETEETDDWKDLCISTLWEEEFRGLGDSKKEALIDDVTTLGGLEKLRGLVGTDADHLSKLLPKGIGDALADELENRHLDFVAKFQSAASDAEQPDEYVFNDDVMERIEALKEDNADWLSSENVSDTDTFEAGEYAFSTGFDDPNVPYDVGTTELDDWLRGYFSAKALASIEDEDDVDDYAEEANEDNEEIVEELTSVDEL